MTSVAIPFVRIDAKQNPNVKVTTGVDPAEPYFRSMTVAFGSIRRWNPNVKLEFISNSQPPARYQAIFEQFGVKTSIVPFDHQPPEGFAKRFTASLYLLDALAHLTDTTLLLDPDVLCIGGLDSMVRRTEGDVGALLMDFPPGEDINGLTRQQAGELHGLLGEPEPAPAHYGGEAYLIPHRYRHAILARVEQAWAMSLSQHAAGGAKFLTEEHILSYALKGFRVANLDRDIKRIWTTHRYRTVDRKEHQLTLWHLPAEKDRGFLALFPYALEPESWFWKAPAETFISEAGKALGLHNRSFVRLVKDSIGAVVRRIENSGTALRTGSAR
jgi:hypothetical protein